MLPAVKFANGTDDTLVGLAVPYGGPFMWMGRPSDLDGERFTDQTDLCLDWFDSRPLLYNHGHSEASTDVVGRVIGYEKQTDGVWAQMILDRSTRYFETLKELIEAGKLYLSSGAMAGLVESDKAGNVLKWPWVELSLTETPSNLLAVIDAETAAKHFKSAGIEAAWTSNAMPAVETKSTDDPDLEVPEAEPLSLTAARFADMACTLAESAKALSERRAATGRKIKAANLEAITEAKAKATAAVDALTALIADATETEAKAPPPDDMRIKVAIQAERIRMLAS